MAPACTKQLRRGRPKLGFEQRYGGFANSTKRLKSIGFPIEKKRFWAQSDRNSEKHVFGRVQRKTNEILHASFWVYLGSRIWSRNRVFSKVVFRCLFVVNVFTGASKRWSLNTRLGGFVADAGVRDSDGPPLYFARFRHPHPSFLPPPCPLFLNTAVHHASDDHLRRFTSLLGAPGDPGWPWFRDFHASIFMWKFTLRLFWKLFQHKSDSMICVLMSAPGARKVRLWRCQKGCQMALRSLEKVPKKRLCKGTLFNSVVQIHYTNSVSGLALLSSLFSH